jgi:hypothetical protein
VLIRKGQTLLVVKWQEQLKEIHHSPLATIDTELDRHLLADIGLSRFVVEYAEAGENPGAADIDPPCRDAYDYEAELAKESWLLFRTVLSIETGVLALGVIFALVAVHLLP